MTAVPLDFAIGRATMVNVARGIPIHVAVQILAIVQREYIVVTRLASPHGFLFGDLFTQVLDDAAARTDVSPGKSAQAVNLRFFEYEPLGLGNFRFLATQIHTLAQELLWALEFRRAGA